MIPQAVPSPRPTRRNRGSSIAEMLIALSLLGAGAMGMDAVDIWKDEQQIDFHRYQQAVVIAEGQMTYLGSLHFEELLPTPGYEAAPWIHQPGYALGEFPVEVRDETGRVLESHSYRVALQLTNLDEAALVRKVELRVHWSQTDGTERTYTMSHVRFH